jgi:Photosynthesis system II assembly factor YCF48/Putative zinc-finger
MQDVPKIVLKRLQETAAAGPHPDADLLTAFAEQSLAESECARVMDHLAGCSDCREVLALALPAIELVVVAASTTPARSRWFTWPVLRWGVAVAGIIAIASIGIVQYRQRQKSDTLVSSLASPNETTAAPQQALPPSAPASELQESVRQAEKEKQAQLQKWALSSRADNSAENMLVRPANPTSPAARAMHIGPPGTTASGSIRTGPAGAAAPKAALSPPRNTFAVAAGAKNTTHEAAAKPAPSPSASQAVEATSSSQTVEVVESQVAPVAPPAKDQVSDQLDQKQKELQSQYDSSASLSVLEAKNLAAAQAGSGTQRVSPRWSISAGGALQRSLDEGKTWLDVDVNVNSGLVSTASNMPATAESTYGQENRKKKAKTQPVPSPVFRAVSAQGAEVWAGGSAAMLYHSGDSGAHWARVLPSSPGATLTGDITSIAFSDAQHGRILTSAGEVWVTSDDGQTWHRQ